MNDLIRQMPVYAAASPDETFVDFHTRMLGFLQQEPERIALVDAQGSWTRAQLLRQAQRIGNRLRSRGLRTGDTVAILADNANGYIAVLVGILAAGGCVVPLSSLASARTLGLMLEDCDARFLFSDHRHRPVIDEVAEQLIRIDPEDRVLLDGQAPGWSALEDWLGDVAQTPPQVRIAAEDPFNIIYSSGTTGVPKGIVHDQRMRLRNMERFRRLGFDAEAVTLVATPMYSNTTMVSVLPSLCFGSRLILMPKFDARRYLQLAEQHRVTHGMLVPVQIQRLLDEPDFARYDLRHFRLKLSAGAPLRSRLIGEAMARWPGNLLEIYGMTEGGISAMLDCASFPHKWDSVGRPSEGCSLQIIDEQGRPLPTGQIGEIVGRATGMMRGYYKRPESTAQMLWEDADGQVHFRSGDMGRFDEDGFLYVLDRRKDMILSGGFNIFAEDLERVLLEHPQVADAAVIAVPSERWGETPLGLVVLRPGASLDAGTLLEWANQRLDKPQRLSALELRDELPRNPAGKLPKKELREPYWRAHATRVA